MSADDRVLSGKLGRLGRLAALGPRAGMALARGVIGQDEGGAGFGGALFDTLGRLKGGSLKLGQLLAQVGDDLPAGARLRLGELYASAPPLDPDALARVLTAELGASPEERFRSFDRQPLAAASLGQVHRAVLHDGTEVAVKIQYPGADEALRHDLELLEGALGTASLGGALLDVRGWLVALREATLAELDYTAEQARLERMRAALAPWPDLVIPRVHGEVSSKRVLTLGFIPGPTLHAWMDGPALGSARAAQGRRLVRAVLAPPLLAGIVNADAHPGNFLVTPQGALGLVDFGAVVSLPAARQEGLRGLFGALLEPQAPAPPRAIEILEEAGMPLRLPEARARRFAADLFAILRPAFQGPYDFARGSVLGGLGRLKQERPLDSLGGRPTPDVLPLLRALVGVHHALVRLGVPVDVRAEAQALLAVRA